MANSEVQSFYKEQNVLVTGGTGFMGKVLLEKLLRSTDVATVYVLVREKKGKNALARIDELCEDAIFDRLKEDCPKFKHKIEAVSGDCSIAGLGLSITNREKIYSNVNIVFHMAATVRFDENLKLAYNINVNATKEILDICRQIKNLKSVVHISTAYSNCHLGEIEERFYDYPVNYNDVGLLLEKVSKHDVEALTPRIIGKWPNTYTFTKALAEDLIRKEGYGLPLGIFRPSIVISTYQEPVKGWIDNLYGPTGVCAACLTGVMRVMRCKDDAVADLVPVDTCVAAVIASAWDVANKTCTRSAENIPIYNYVSSAQNPITWKEYIELNVIHGNRYPLTTSLWTTNITTVENFNLYCFLRIFCHLIPGIVFDSLAVLSGRKPKLLEMYRKIHKFSDVLSFFCMREWKFSNDNIQKLWLKLSLEDQKLFPLNMKQLNWLAYYRSYIRGIRVYLLKESENTVELAKKKQYKLGIIDVVFKIALSAILTLLAWYFFSYLFSKLFS